jgi:hypothetical protein
MIAANKCSDRYSLIILSPAVKDEKKEGREFPEMSEEGVIVRTVLLTRKTFVPFRLR